MCSDKIRDRRDVTSKILINFVFCTNNGNNGNGNLSTKSLLGIIFFKTVFNFVINQVIIQVHIIKVFFEDTDHF